MGLVRPTQTEHWACDKHMWEQTVFEWRALVIIHFLGDCFQIFISVTNKGLQWRQRRTERTWNDLRTGFIINIPYYTHVLAVGSRKKNGADAPRYEAQLVSFLSGPGQSSFFLGRAPTRFNFCGAVKSPYPVRAHSRERETRRERKCVHFYPPGVILFVG